MRSRYIIVLMVPVPFVLVFLEQYFLGRIEDPSVGGFAGSILLIFLILWWVLRDSAERDVTVPYYLKMLLVLIAAIGLPIYLFRSRGFRGGLLAMAAAVCVGVLLIASAWIGAVAGDHAATFVDQRAWSRCSAQADISLDSRIEGCTTLIDSWRRPRHRKSAEALFQRGRAYYEKGDRERAIADLKRAVEDTLSPRTPENATLNRALCDFSHQAELSVSFLCGRPR
jgi:tetratricopeptide (TPR) repeat protein